MQTMSTEGLKRLINREGSRTKAYKDTKGIWTIGVGHTAAAGPPAPKAGMVITEAEVVALLAKDIKQYEQAVRDSIKVPLADHQFDALVSICFNIGTGGFKGSTMVKRINAGADPVSIRSAILMWNKPSEIIGRRKSEADQYETPYNGLGVPVTAPKPPQVSPVPKVTPAAPGAPGASQVANKAGGLFGPLIDRLRAAFPPK